MDDRVHVLVGVDHPMADAGGYVLQHRLIAAAAIGRHLSRDEHVHHINGDHKDNRPENLIVVSPSQHSRIHAAIRRGTDPLLAVAEVVG